MKLKSPYSYNVYKKTHNTISWFYSLLSNTHIHQIQQNDAQDFQQFGKQERIINASMKLSYRFHAEATFLFIKCM